MARTRGVYGGGVAPRGVVSASEFARLRPRHASQQRTTTAGCAWCRRARRTKPAFGADRIPIP